MWRPLQDIMLREILATAINDTIFCKGERQKNKMQYSTSPGEEYSLLIASQKDQTQNNIPPPPTVYCNQDNTPPPTGFQPAFLDKEISRGLCGELKLYFYVRIRRWRTIKK